MPSGRVPADGRQHTAGLVQSCIKGYPYLHAGKGTWYTIKLMKSKIILTQIDPLLTLQLYYEFLADRCAYTEADTGNYIFPPT